MVDNAVADTALKWMRAKRLTSLLSIKKGDEEIMTAAIMNTMMKTTLVAYPCAIHQDNFPMKSVWDMFKEMQEDQESKFRYLFSPKNIEKVFKCAKEIEDKQCLEPLQKAFTKMAQCEEKQTLLSPWQPADPWLRTGGASHGALDDASPPCCCD